MIPVPNAALLIEDDGWLYDPDLSDGSHSTDANGLAQVPITFDDAKENSLNPFFTITIPESDRTVPAGSPSARQFELPDEWVTRHYVNRRIPRITDHADPNNPLDVYVGLHAKLRVSYTDFHQTGIRNPFALPEDTVRIYLADYDWFNRDDTLGGFGFNPRGNRIIPVGEEDRYPYFDGWPTAPVAMDGLPDSPRAWLDPPGSPVGQLGGGSFQTVGPLTVDPQGMVFMIDGNAVRRSYPDGTLCETIEEWPGTGTLPTQHFNAPEGLAVDQHGNLFVADTGNDRIVWFRPGWRNGQEQTYVHVQSIDTLSLPPSLFDVSIDAPRGLAVLPSRVVDEEELLAIANTGTREVLVFRIRITGDSNRSHRMSAQLNVDLSYLTKFGATGTNADQFQEPVGVAADRSGRLFVCDRQLHRVSRWRVDGARASFAHEATWDRGGGQSGSGNGEFDTPISIAIDPNKNHVYVLESGNQRIQRLDGDTGSTRLQWRTEIAGTPTTPVSVAVDGRGEVYVADSSGVRVLRATVFNEDGSSRGDADEPRPVGSPWTPAGETEHMAKPAYVTFDPHGKLWVSDSGNHRVLAFAKDSDGALTPDTSTGAPLTGLDEPAGIAMDPEGNLFVVDSANHRVVKFSGSPLTQDTSSIGTGTAGTGDDQFDHPRGIAVAQRVEPHLYVADRGNNRVQVMQRDGTLVRSLALPSGGAFDGPEDVAVDSRGNVYVADTGNARIVQFDPSDTFVRQFNVPNPDLPSATMPEPCGIFVDNEDKLIVTDRARNRVLRVEADGTLLALWDLKALLRMQAASNRMYEPELARMLTFDKPSRAVVEPGGLMAVADTGRDRVRLVRTCTDLEVNLFDLGGGLENLPDISFRAVTEADWKEELGLELKVGDLWPWDDSQEFASEPQDDFSDDAYPYTAVLREGNRTNAAINVMKVVRMAQRWYQHCTRADDAEHRWGTESQSRELDVNLIDGDDTQYFLMLELHLGQDVDRPGGRGPDAWDDSVVVHEMNHWVFYRALRPYPPFTLKGLIWDISLSHNRHQITSYNQALTEGWAEYVECFWGSEYGAVDRVRGYSMLSHGLSNVVERGRTNCQYLFGGPVTAPRPAFNEPRKALEIEGYLSNALYQIHCALADPGRIFADAPAFWYGYNMSLSEEQSRRYSSTIWRALRLFPDDPPLEDLDRASLLYLRNLMTAVRESQPGFYQMVQSILELNNLLTPVITISEGTSTTAPGTALGDTIEMEPLGIKSLIVRVTDERGHPLEGYNVNFAVSDVNDYELSPASTGQARHGRVPATGLNRVTNASGIVNVVFEASPLLSDGRSETMTITYQPDFDTDETFSPPTKADDRETTLRKLYLYELRSASKTWEGTGSNFGALVSRTVTFSIRS
jgi:DNA-binding beta-propeller fold protein YncE